MKKILIAVLVIASVFAFVSCSKKAATTTPAPAATTTTAAAPAPAPAATPAPAAPAKKSYKLGMGVTFEPTVTDAQVQYDAVVATVVVDENGKIVACQIDEAQNKMSTTDIDPEATFLSKYEKKFDYNMAKFSEATNEWFQQIDAFEAYVIGKTGAEVAAMPTRVRGADEPHPDYIVTADETLFASCSIQISAFKEAVAKACEDAKAQEFETAGKFTLGVAINSTAEESVAATETENGTIKMYAEFGAAVVDEKGVVLAALTDAIQPQFVVDPTGALVSETYKGTKKELEFGYNMVKFSEATNEWFEQARAFEDYCEGKTAAQIAALPTRERTADEPHPGYVVTTDETLFASCSIQITGMKAIVAKAAENAN